jgi:DNA-binding transcriptional LysR family regulator
MDSRALRYFSVAYEERSLTAAARRCFIAQPSISSAVSALERELGTTLFIRNKKGVSPTQAGDELYLRSRRILNEMEAVSEHFRKPAKKRNFSLGLMRALDIPRTMALLKPLTAAPDLHLHLVAAEAACDARIISKLMLHDTETFFPFWTERYVVALPPAHELTFKPRLTVSDLSDVRLIQRCHCEYADVVARTGARIQTVAVAESEEWALALVRAGVGVAIVPEGVTRTASDIAIREIEDLDVTRQVGLAYGGSGSPTEDIQRLLDAFGIATHGPAELEVSKRLKGKPRRATQRKRDRASRGRPSRKPH